jgi:hypothetical protein
VSKKFKGKTCVYCGVEGASSTPDHVVARNFFAQPARANLPKVPACQSCNEAKSRLEHYLTTVLPFGANHEDANRNLIEEVPRRLSKNDKLFRQLRSGMVEGIATSWTGMPVPELSLPFEGDKLSSLFGQIAKG